MDNKAFDFKRIAQGYKERTFLHKFVIEDFQKISGTRRFSKGLDVGCGAGLSAKALAQICDQTIGIDISPEMIEVAKEVCADNDRIQFAVSSAEAYQCKPNQFDLVTAAGVVQWVEVPSFLANMQRMMQSGGWLLIYDFAISDEMLDCPEYTVWWQEQYLKEFPRPYRNEAVWTKEDVEPFGFAVVNQSPSRMEYVFEKDAFISFMMIQSNVNAKIEGAGGNSAEIRKWFERTLEPIFQDGKRTLIFKGYQWCFQKSDAISSCANANTDW